ncbi:hypothetical protein E6C67_03225 (plasmid) [Azospirillum sp. TSA2s]|uniref:hypothetical protein n=1 Tax=Azospirillum sp. TSA2s TaxID=709810 RepID=UPI0010A9A16F|nr:hypothetical protein [Azospirillum sp. TSA2s]QCG92975.1 hypothetical protein E6C67_03225 [Azospirillum sp. TSA2s]
MLNTIFSYTDQHREVEWLDRHTPPEPGMILLEQRCTGAGERVMFVWGWPTPQSFVPAEIVCWSEPNVLADQEKLGPGAIVSG